MGITEVRALDGVSLRIERGEFVAIVGASGSGKSTIMHVVGCLDRPTSGTYRFLDKGVSKLSDRQLARLRNRSIGFVFQTFNLVSRMSAWENVAMPLFYARQARTKADAMKALERVSLTDRAGHQPNELSGGERQRVAIARAIVNRPALILADEPTGNLDTRTGEQIMRIFHELHEGGATIIVVTHERDIAERADRIVTMRDGKIIDERLNERRRAPGVDGVYPPSDREYAAAVVASADPVHVGCVAGAQARPSADAGAPTAKAMGHPAMGHPSPTAKAMGHPPDTVAAPAYGQTAEATLPQTPAAALVTHPLAKGALKWALVGPACLVAMPVSGFIMRFLREINPVFAAIAGSLVSLALLAMLFVGPIVAFIKGRRASRWIRLAPDKYGGLGRARAAQWICVAHVVIVAVFFAISIYRIWTAIQSGAFESMQSG